MRKTSLLLAGLSAFALVACSDNVAGNDSHPQSSGTSVNAAGRVPISSTSATEDEAGETSHSSSEGGHSSGGGHGGGGR